VQAGIGFIEILVLLAGGFGSPTHDLVSLIRAEDYFKSRNVALGAKEMVKRATAEPDSGKAQIQQLLAIRWLGKHPDEARKDNARTALEAIAAGKKAQDKQGFARLYARQALARLDGKPIPAAAPARPGGLKEAISWFPADTTIVAAVELSPPRATVEDGKNPLLELLSRLRPQEREELYKGAEALGNVRLDRFAMGFTPDAKGDIEKIRLRFTGSADPERMAALVGKVNPGVVRKQEKGPKGEPIVLLGGQRPPAMALVSDTDFIMAGYEKNQGNHPAIVSEMLKVRAGKAAAVQTGALGNLLKDLPRNVRSFLAAELSDKMREQMQRDLRALPSLPQRVLAHVTRGDPADATKAGLHIIVEGTFKDATEAKNFAEAAQGLKQQGLKVLENPPPQAPRAPRELIRSAQQALKGLTIKPKGPAVRTELSLPNDSIIRDALKWFMVARTARSVPPAPPR
jgi:hypothetical protein